MKSRDSTHWVSPLSQEDVGKARGTLQQWGVAMETRWLLVWAGLLCSGRSTLWCYPSNSSNWCQQTWCTEEGRLINDITPVLLTEVSRLVRWGRITLRCYPISFSCWCEQISCVEKGSLWCYPIKYSSTLYVAFHSMLPWRICFERACDVWCRLHTGNLLYLTAASRNPWGAKRVVTRLRRWLLILCSMSEVEGT